MRLSSSSCVTRACLVAAAAAVAASIPAVLACPFSAVAVLTPTTNSSTYGIATIQQTDCGDATVTVAIQLTGLAPNTTHGVHVHQWGDVSRADGLASGLHFNPTNLTHGCPVLPGSVGVLESHVGDLGNVEADAWGGLSVILKISNGMSLVPSELGFVVGRTIIVHAQRDDCTTQPTGASGSRLAQGVFGWTLNAYAIAVLHPTNTTVSGNVLLSQAVHNGQTPAAPVMVQLNLTGLEPGSVHGVHIHEFGDLTNPMGLSAGGHFNPSNATHGCPPSNNTDANPPASASTHGGDLGNVTADQEGNVSATLYTRGFSLDPLAPGFAIGRAFVVHSRSDDCVSQPVGNAGYRVALGVIGIRAPPTIAPRSLANWKRQMRF
ncbi:superoxide dismutase [Entophlyctis helioformis]|nr:superoxide dismutase [Entophlyctis helioformis]